MCVCSRVIFINIYIRNIQGTYYSWSDGRRKFEHFSIEISIELFTNSKKWWFNMKRKRRETFLEQSEKDSVCHFCRLNAACARSYEWRCAKGWHRSYEWSYNNISHDSTKNPFHLIHFWHANWIKQWASEWDYFICLYTTYEAQSWNVTDRKSLLIYITFSLFTRTQQWWTHQ